MLLNVNWLRNLPEPARARVDLSGQRLAEGQRRLWGRQGGHVGSENATVGGGHLAAHVDLLSLSGINAAAFGTLAIRIASFNTLAGTSGRSRTMK